MRMALAAGLLLASSMVCAAPQEQKGFYVGAGLGSSSIQLDDTDSPVDFKGDDFGFKVFGGYRFLPWVAAEVSYDDFGKVNDHVLGERIRAEFYSFNVSALGLWPIGPVDLFVRGGIGAWHGKLTNRDFGGSDKDHDVDPIVGLGVQYHLGQIDLRAEVESVLLDASKKNEENSADLASVGVFVRF